MATRSLKAATSPLTLDTAYVSLATGPEFLPPIFVLFASALTHDPLLAASVANRRDAATIAPGTSSRDFVLLVPESEELFSQETVDELNLLGIICVRVGPIQNPFDPFNDGDLRATMKSITFLKLWAWTLPYDRVVYVDGDALLLGDMQPVFECPEPFCAVPDSAFDYLNAGMLSLQPSMATFSDMLLHLDALPSWDGADQGWLFSYFGFDTLPPAARLSIRYNGLVNHLYRMGGWITPQWSLLHYAGCRKPWHWLTFPLFDAEGLWWRQVDATPGLASRIAPSLAATVPKAILLTLLGMFVTVIFIFASLGAPSVSHGLAHIHSRALHMLSRWRWRRVRRRQQAGSLATPSMPRALSSPNSYAKPPAVKQTRHLTSPEAYSHCLPAVSLSPRPGTEVSATRSICRVSPVPAGRQRNTLLDARFAHAMACTKPHVLLTLAYVTALSLPPILAAFASSWLIPASFLRPQRAWAAAHLSICLAMLLPLLLCVSAHFRQGKAVARGLTSPAPWTAATPKAPSRASLVGRCLAPFVLLAFVVPATFQVCVLIISRRFLDLQRHIVTTFFTGAPVLVAVYVSLYQLPRSAFALGALRASGVPKASEE
jgi:hypothetical protein